MPTPERHRYATILKGDPHGWTKQDQETEDLDEDIDLRESAGTNRCGCKAEQEGGGHYGGVKGIPTILRGGPASTRKWDLAGCESLGAEG